MINSEQYRRAQFDRMTSLMAAARRVLLRQDRGPNLTRATAFLRESIDIANALDEPEYFVTASNDLAHLLVPNARNEEAGAREALAVSERAVQVARTSGQLGHLGLLLTTLAEVRLRSDRTKPTIAQSRLELEEALPLRDGPVDTAYTMSNLARVMTLDVKSSPDEAIADTLKALDYFEKSIRAFLETQGAVSALGLAAANYASALMSAIRIERVANLGRMVSAESDLAEELDMQDAQLIGQLSSLAIVNPQALGDADVAQALADMPSPSISDNLMKRIAVAADLLRKVQQQSSIANAHWSEIEHWLCEVERAISAPTAEDQIIRQRLILTRTSPEEDPENWCTWAVSLMDLLASSGRYTEAAAVGRDALSAYSQALQDNPASANMLVAASFHYLARRAALLHMEIGDPERAVAILTKFRGQARLRGMTDRLAVDPDPLAVSSRWHAALIFLLAGPDSVYFIAVDGRSAWRYVSHRFEDFGGKVMVPLVMGFSPETPGLLGAQHLSEKVFERTLIHIYDRLRPLMQALNRWLNDLAVADIILIPVGPYAYLPLGNTPIDVDGKAVPFNWTRRLVLLPSQVFPSTSDDPRAPIRSVLLAADPVRPDLPRLRTRSECESIRVRAESHGWDAQLLLGIDVVSTSLMGDAANKGIVHYAGHATTSSVDPDSTVLCLSDGNLSLNQILEKMLGVPQVLVLSACQTGQSSSLDSPDENFGFPAVAMGKGVYVSVGSLWPVRDRETSKLMKAFYGSLIPRLNRAREVTGFVVHEALVDAQKTLGAPDLTRSRDWSAFQVFGV